MNSRRFKSNRILAMILVVFTVHTGFSQSDSSEISDLERTFMPTIQLGFVDHLTPELSGGLMTQTSLEYRDISNFIFRLNYDALNSNMRVAYPLDSNTTYTGRTTFSDLIAGVGYRIEMNKHFITNYVQAGVRFYGFPIFNQEAAIVNFDMNSRRIGLIRYSLGYEYMLAPKLFFTIEALAGYVFKPVDFWAENQLSYGISVGLSAPLF